MKPAKGRFAAVRWFGGRFTTAAHETRPAPARQSLTCAPALDDRGVFAPFVALIAVALMLLGSIAYDAPRIIAARQDAHHAASEAARVAAITIASGGSLVDATSAAENRMEQTPLVYGEKILVASVECVGSLVEVTVVSGYIMRSILAAAVPRRPIIARGSAEAVLIRPDGEQEQNIKHLGECPIFASN